MDGVGGKRGGKMVGRGEVVSMKPDLKTVCKMDCREGLWEVEIRFEKGQETV